MPRSNLSSSQPTSDPVAPFRSPGERPCPGNNGKSRWLAIGVAFLVSLVFFSLGEGKRVGDGGEYYCMALALAKNAVPYATPEVWDEYEQLRTARPELKMPPKEVVARFTELQIGDEHDFPHFWFYSVGPALIYKCFAPWGLSLPQAFTAFHYLITVAVALVCLKFFGLPGILAFFLLWLGSPLLWYSNKVHTEFLTVLIGLLAVIATLRRVPLWAMLCLSILATQNPAFALAAFACGLWLLVSWLTHSFRLRELAIAGISASLVLLHPAYYYFRYGEITPQYLTGAAGSFFGLPTALIPVFDPNLGILFAWPLGTLALLFLGARILQNRQLLYRHLPLFSLSILWVALAIYSHGSTGHQNHGAIVSGSRYGLWYIPLIFPALLVIVQYSRRHWKRTSTRILAILVVALGIGSTVQNLPRHSETNSKPTPMGRLVMKMVPNLYDPFPEVFRDRYMKSAKYGPILMLHTPSRKLLWDRSGSMMELVTDDRAETSLRSVAQFYKVLGTYETGCSRDTFNYFHLTDQQIDALLDPPDNFDFQLLNAGMPTASIYFGEGWHGPEETHRWSSEVAVIRVPANISIALLEITAPFKTRLTVMNLQTGTAKDHDLADEAATVLAFEPTAANQPYTDFSLQIHQPWKPSEKFESEDNRLLGINATHLILYTSE